MSEGTPINAPATDTETAEVEAPTTTETEVDHAAEAEKWKALARKHETTAKANKDAAKELERIKLEGLDETGKAVEAAKASTRAEVLAEVGAELVEAQIRALASGHPDVDAVIEGIDPRKFLNDEGRPDSDAIAAWVARIAPAPAESADETPPGFPPPPDIGQGVRQAAVPLNGDPLLSDLKSKLGIA